MTNGIIVILSGPSGSGKTTLHQKLLKDPSLKGRLVRSLSATTRSRRPGEKNGKDYLFLSREEFLLMKKRGGFLEDMKVFDQYYGTPKAKVDESLRKGKSVLLCIDVKGARVVRRKYPQALKIFVKTPTLTDLKDRLRKRGTENEKTFQLRLKIAKKELKEARHYDHIIINDRVDRAARELCRIVRSAIPPRGLRKAF